MSKDLGVSSDPLSSRLERGHERTAIQGVAPQRTQRHPLEPRSQCQRPRATREKLVRSGSKFTWVGKEAELAPEIMVAILNDRHECTRNERRSGPVALLFDLPVAAHQSSADDGMDDWDVGRHGGARGDVRKDLGALGKRSSGRMVDRFGAFHSSPPRRHLLDGYRRGVWVGPLRDAAHCAPVAKSAGGYLNERFGTGGRYGLLVRGQLLGSATRTRAARN